MFGITVDICVLVTQLASLQDHSRGVEKLVKTRRRCRCVVDHGKKSDVIIISGWLLAPDNLLTKEGR